MRYGWTFLPDDEYLIYRVQVPLQLEYVGEAATPLAALEHASSAIVARVECDGSQWRVTHWKDVTVALHEFACWCADRAMEVIRKQGKEPDPRSLAAIEAKRQWLRGEISDKQLDAARDAARAAAWDAARAAARGAAWGAAWGAARAAARDAAWAAAWAAVRGAAWDATRDAARDAAWDAAWDAENEHLKNVLLEELGLLNGNHVPLPGLSGSRIQG